MKNILLIILILIGVNSLAQNRVNIQRGLQQCTDNGAPVRFGGTEVPGCTVFTDSLGRQTYCILSSFIRNDSLINSAVNITDNTDTLYQSKVDLSSLGGGGIYTHPSYNTSRLLFSDPVTGQPTDNGAWVAATGLRLYNNTTSYMRFLSTNVGIGANAGDGFNTIFGGRSVAIGHGAGAANIQNDNTFVGYNAGVISTGADNTFIGAYAGGIATGGTGNTFVGFQSGANTAVGGIATGERNTFIGTNTGLLNSDGYRNTILGYEAGVSNVSGDENVLLGYEAGYNILGADNVAIGARAGYTTTGGSNVFIGYEAGRFATGSDQLFIDNSSTSSPLIQGDFSTNILDVNGQLIIRDLPDIATVDTLLVPNPVGHAVSKIAIADLALGGGGGDNFANADLTATGDRTHDFTGAFGLIIDNATYLYVLQTALISFGTNAANHYIELDESTGDVILATGATAGHEIFFHAQSGEYHFETLMPLDNTEDEFVMIDAATGDLERRTLASIGAGPIAFADLTDYPADAAGALTNDGAGNLSWAAAGGADLLGTAFGAEEIVVGSGTTSGASFSDFTYNSTFKNLSIGSGFAYVRLSVSPVASIDIANTSTVDIRAASSSSDAYISVDGNTGADSYIRYYTNGIVRWRQGIDDAISSDWRMYNGSLLSTAWSTALATNITTFNADVIVPTEVYGVGWNGSNEVPTKDALYDKIETIGGGGGDLNGLSDVVITTPTSGQIISYNGINWVNGGAKNIAESNLVFNGHRSHSGAGFDLSITGLADVTLGGTGTMILQAGASSDVTFTAGSFIVDAAGTMDIESKGSASDAYITVDGFTGNDAYVRYQINNVGMWSQGVDNAINTNWRIYNESLASTAWSIALATNITTFNSDINLATGAEITSNSGIDLILDAGGAGNVVILNDILDVQSNLIWVNTNSTADYAATLRLTGEGTLDNYQGIYFQYDAAGNQSVIGSHNTNDALTASDIELILFPRDGAHVDFQGDVIIQGVIYLNAGKTLGIFTGSGTPESAVAADVGSTFHRTDGGASTSYYVKETGTGNTGWIAK